MALIGLARLADRYRRVVVLAALLTTFAGVALLLDRPKGGGVAWVGLPLAALGSALFAWAAWPLRASSASRDTLASRAIRAITLQGRLLPFLPAFGAAMIVADLAYNLVLSATPALLTEDVIVLLAAAAFLGHGFVPQRFGKERDFVLLFFIALNAILVVPLLVARLYYQDFERSVDLYSWIALAPETGAILSVVGVPNTVQAVAGSTAPGLTFTPLHLGVPVTVVITTACSGIYSFGIFASAFVAFVMTEYERPSTRLWAFLGLGFLAAYIANVLRLVVIVLVGFHTDTSQTDLQNMLVAHTYAGWLIFLAWVALFWSLLFRFVPVQPTTVEGGRLPTRRNESRCGICGNALSPAIPATKCACGAYHHRACIENAKRCSSCGRMVSVSVEGSLSYADVGG